MTYSKIFSAVLFLTLSFSIGCSVESKKGKGVKQGAARDFSNTEGTNFRVGAIKGNSVQITGKNSYGLDRKKLFNLEACIRNATGASVLPDLKFSVSDENGGKLSSLLTDINGCIIWTEEHEFNYVSPESYFQFRRVISADEVYKGSVVVDVAFNPWQSANPILDLRYNTLPDSKKAETSKTGVSVQGSRIEGKNANDFRLHLDSIAFDSEGYDYSNYEINDFLGLTVAHKYEVILQPKLLRKTLTSDEEEVTLLRGKFKISLALLKENSQDNELIAYADYVGDIKSSRQIKESIVIKIDSVANLTARSKLIVTVEPVEHLGGSKDYSFEALMRPGRLSKVVLAPSEKNARELIEVHKKEKKEMRTKVSATQLFENSLKLPPLKIREQNQFCFGFLERCQNLSLDEVVEMIVDKNTNGFARQYLIKELCKNTVPVNLKNICLSRPGNYLTIKAVQIVDKVHGAPQKVGESQSSTVNFQMGFSKSKSNSIDSTFGAKAESSIGIGSGAPESIVKASIGGSVYMSTSYSMTDSSNSNMSISASTGYNVNAEANRFLIDVTSRHCLIVSPTNLAKELYQTKIVGGFYCSKKLRREKRIETYYLLTRSSDAGSLISDNESEQEIGSWNMLVRGDQTFKMLQNFVKSLETPLFLQKMPEINKNSPEWREFQMTQEFPGVLSAQ